VGLIEPIQARFHEYRNDETFLNSIMKSGADKASQQASKILTSVYDAVGFIARP